MDPGPGLRSLRTGGYPLTHLRIGSPRNWFCIIDGFTGARFLGGQIDSRDWLPLGVREGRNHGWIVIPIWRRRWITVGKVR